MPLPTLAALNTAINDVYATLADRKIRGGNRSSVMTLNEIFPSLVNAYSPDQSLTVTDATEEILNTFFAGSTVPAIDFVVTDATDASLVEFFVTTGELAVALGADAAVGDIFQVGGAEDTTDNALEGAKGSAVVDNDIFIVTDIGSETVVFLGNGTIVAGELYVAFARAIRVGDIFVVGGAGDTTDNALESAKGSAVAATDLFQVASITAGAEGVTYLGQVGDLDFTAEKRADFIA